MRSAAAGSPIRAVFLDWAGTAVDHGSMAPVKALEDVFASFGIAVTDAQIRRSMGLAKKDHVRKLLEEPEVRAQWAAVRAGSPSERDVDAIYAGFEPQMMLALVGCSTVIGGVVEAVAAMRERGIQIAGTTGYTRPMLERLQELAAEQGYRTDASLAPEDVGAGRPFPYMCYRLAIDLRVYPFSACVKIGDTESDIAEGRNAGMWTIGVTRSGNSVGLSEEAWRRLGGEERAAVLARAEAELRAAGAHFTAETVADAMPVLEEIERRIAAGEVPR
jgi:phosphonoacetaldehyde hydrolase